MSLYASQALLDRLSDGVIVVSRSGRPAFANLAARTWLGLTHDAALPAGLGAWFGPAGAWDQLLTEGGSARLSLNDAVFDVSSHQQGEQTTVVLKPGTDPISKRAAEPDQRARRLSALVSASAAISRSLDPNHIAQLTTEEAAAVVGVEQASLLLLDHKAGVGRVIACHPPFPKDAPPIDLSIRGNPALGEVVKTARPLVVEDGPGDSALAAGHGWMGEEGVRSIMVVPLVVGGRVTGALGLGSTRARRTYRQEEISLAQTIANQAAVALENARLFGQAEAHMQAQETLFRVGTALGSTRDLRDLLQLVIESAVETIPHATEGVIHVYDSETDLLTAGAWSGGESGAGRRLAEAGTRLGVGVMGRALAEQRMINVRDTLASEEVVAGSLPHSVRSLLVTPLEVEGRLLGTISVTSPLVAGFTAEDENMLALLATQTAVALENTRLHAASRKALQDLKERADWLALVNRLSAQFGSTLNSQEIMDTVVGEMAHVTSVDECRLVLFDSESGYGTIRAANVPVKDAQERLVPMEGNPSYEMLLKTRQPLAIEDVSTHPATALLAPRYRIDDVRSMLIVPMMVQDRLIGSVGLNVVGQRRKFSSTEIEMCAIIGNQAAIALENARLYEAVRQFTEELEQRVEERTQDLARERDRVSSLLRITAELSTSLDLDRVLYRALELVREAVGASHGSIMLVDQMTGSLVLRAELGRAEPLPPEGERLPFRRGEGLAGWVVQNHRSVIVDDTAKDERWKTLPGHSGTQRSVMAVPLATGEEVVGVLMLASSTAKTFSNPQLEMVEAAAMQVATAINNAELFKLIRDQADQLGSMMRVDREEAAKSAAILESVADGVLVVDARGKVILFNAAAESILELERSQILGEPMSRFMGLWGRAGSSWAEAIEEWTQSVEVARSRQFVEERLELGDKVVSVHLAPVLSGGGFVDFLGIVSVFRDITRDVELDRMQREWVSTVSHELRTPMTSIKGYADLLILGAVGPVTEGQRRFLEIIKNNADRLSLLVNDLLDISRIETGRMRLDLKAINLYQLLDTVLKNLIGRREQEGKEIRVSLQLPAGLPHVRGDVDRVTQVMTNLLDNAYNYTPARGSIVVAARHRSPDSRVLIEVKDTGIGISAEDQARIFERFYRSDHPEVQKVSGTGLGLAIVNHLVEMHGGRLRVFSEGIGKGSTFSFTLPVAKEGVLTDEYDG